MDEQTVRKIVKEIIEADKRKSQYSVARVPFHVHNGIDSPLLGGSGLTAGGSTTQVQYNNNGVFAGSNNLTFNNSTKQLYVGPTSGGSIALDGPLIVSKGTASSSYIQFTDTGVLTVRQFSVNTTDATATTIAQIFPQSATLLYFHIFGERTGGSAGTAGDAAGYIRSAMYKFTTVPVLVGSVTDIMTSESQAGWDVSFTAGVTDVTVKVTGAANNNVSWRAIMYAYSDFAI